MVALLPDENVNHFIENLDTVTFKELFISYEPIHDAMIYLPVFKVDERVPLKEVLQAMGMEISFIENADFSLMGPDLHIEKVVHRAIIEVDEVGTKAAAATGVVEANESAVEEPWTFNADRPFIFFIYDSEQELVLFASKVVDIQ